MATIMTIDPVTRIEGHLKIEVTIEVDEGVQQVVDARASGTLFRGFESILVGRQPDDAQHITQRICGVCPVSHGLASVLAQDAVAGVTVPDNARIMRNLVLGANYIQSHILHFYHLAVQDFVDGPDMPPWQPSWKADKRITDAGIVGTLVGHYVAALDMRRKAQEMGALFGGRLPHPPAFIPGGFTTQPDAERIGRFQTYLHELKDFIQDVYIPDVTLAGQVYHDYYDIGRGYGNLLAFGVFDLDASGSAKLLDRGAFANGTTDPAPVDVDAITEHVAHSWYSNRTNDLRPSDGATEPQYPKGDAYSWLKAPRYGGVPYEVGPLARMWVNGDYREGVSVMDRHAARAREAQKVALAMDSWLGQLEVGRPVYTEHRRRSFGAACGLTEAPRGALGHWLRVGGGRIDGYQVVTPTCWNASPRDSDGQRGPIEEALIGTPVGDINEPVEVVRVIHSFDPCLACAVHVMRPAEGASIFALGHLHGEDGAVSHAHGHEHAHA